jgi:fluoride exporter
VACPLVPARQGSHILSVRSGHPIKAPSMKEVLLVAVGGGIGAAARYKLGGWVLHHTPDWRFPVATFGLNVLGCLVAGVLWGIAEKHALPSPDARLFLFTGVLGGFTTFSAFGLETVALLRRAEAVVAGCYVVLSVLCGVAAIWVAIAAVRWAAGSTPVPHAGP